MPWRDQLSRSLRVGAGPAATAVEGHLTRMVGLTLEALGCQAAVGERCEVMTSSGASMEAEVVGFAGDRLYLMPTGDVQGIKPGARVIPRHGAGHVRVGLELLGRVIDGGGEPLDGRGPIYLDDRASLTGTPINPLLRAPIERPLDVGVRAINSLLTVGRGQRIGLFAGSGVGKSVLLGMMARYTEADVIVVGLIGERGREVKEFIEKILGETGPRAFGGGGRAGRQPAADAPAWRLDRHGHRRILPRPGPQCIADHGFADALRAGAARDRPRHRRGAGHQGLSAFGVRAPAAAGGARRQRRARSRARSPPSIPC